MLDTPLDVALIITLWASVGGLAMAHGPAEVLRPLRRVGPVARIIALDVLLVPPATWAVVTILGIPEPFAIGFILIGAAAAGPLGVVAAQIARADTALALALVAVLEVANAAAVPGWAAILLPRSVALPVADVLAVLVAYVLAPLGVGLGLRLLAPAAADRLVGPARVVTITGLAVVVGLVVTGNAHLFGPAAAAGVPVATVVVIAGSLLGGWLAAGDPAAARVAGALVVAQRGTSVALALALTAFADLPEVAVAVVVYGMISVIAIPLIAFVLRRVTSAEYRWAADSTPPPGRVTT